MVDPLWQTLEVKLQMAASSKFDLFIEEYKVYSYTRDGCCCLRVSVIITACVQTSTKWVGNNTIVCVLYCLRLRKLSFTDQLCY